MVVEARVGSKTRNSPVIPAQLDLGYAALFLGLRFNELVRRRLEAAGFGDVRESHGYVIQHLIEEERSITELARRMEVTQQAASKAVAELLRLGVVEAIRTTDRRSKRIRLSARGWLSVKLARQVRRRIESRLVQAVGAAKYDVTKGVILQCLDELGGTERIKTRRIRPPT